MNFKYVLSLPYLFNVVISYSIRFLLDLRYLLVYEAPYKQPYYIKCKYRSIINTKVVISLE